MNPRLVHSALRGALTAIDDLGGKLAKSTRSPLEEAMRLYAAADGWQSVKADPVGAMLAALAAGRDPLADEDVAAAVVGHQLATLQGSARERAGSRLVESVTERLDDLIVAFAKPYADAAQRITAANEVLAQHSIDHDTDAGVILRSGKDVTTAWADVDDAIRTLNKISNGLKLLFGAVGQQMTGAIYADPADADPWVAAHLMGRPATIVQRPLEAINAGMVLSLCSLTEAAERSERVGSAMHEPEGEQRKASRPAPVIAVNLRTGQTITAGS